MLAATSKKVCPVCKGEYVGGEVFCPVDASRLVTSSQMGTGGDPTDPLLGTILANRYKVLERIGEGGMGLVYAAEHTLIEKRVAVKVLRDDFSSRPEVVERFRQEAKSASRIGHEHIVDISDFGETPTGASYFVMEFLDGEDLANVLQRDGFLPAERAIHILHQCCRALGAAHAKGIVHRDMKPENIFLVQRETGDDFVKIVDFGIAKMSDIETQGAPGRKLTKTGMIFGTPEYMSPEQAAGKELDHRVDIYALGVILYECLTGHVPFVGDSFMGILTQHMFEEPPPLRDKNPDLRISADLEVTIYKALAKDPADRFQTMDEMAEALIPTGEGRKRGATLLGHGRPNTGAARAARTYSPTMAKRGQGRGSSGLLIGGALVVLLAAGAGAWFTVGPGAATTPVEPPAVVAPTPPPPPVMIPEPVPPPEPVAVAAPPPEPVAPAPTTASIRVETRPDGASIEVEGEGEIAGCAATPCTIEAPIGQRIVIRAERGRSTGSTEIVPEGATTVQIALLATRRPPRPVVREGTKSGGSTMSGGGDLKIPDIFR